MCVIFRVGNPHRTFINIASCNNTMPMPKKLETYARPCRGKGLCAPVIDKSLLSKSKTGSIAVFRAFYHVSTCVAVYKGSAPKRAFASAIESSSGLAKAHPLRQKRLSAFFINIAVISVTIHRTPFSMKSVFFSI